VFRGLASVIYKETFHILRDPRTLLLVVLLPCMDMIVFGYAIDLQVRHVPTVVYNLDGREPSRRLVDVFGNSGMFQIVEHVGSDNAMRGRIVRGAARVALKIPPDYTDCLVRGEPTTVQVLIDGSDSVTAMQVLNVANAIALRESLTLVASQLDSAIQVPVEARPRVLYNPDMRTTNFMVPGLVAIVMQGLTMILTAFAIVRERENGTLEQLMVTPVSRLGLMLGKLLPYALIGAFDSAMAVLLMRYLFGVPIAGSVGLLAVLSLSFLFACLGYGLFISTIATSQMQAVQLCALFMLPAVVLSGFMFPLEQMPLPVFAISQFVPATYYVRILRGIILRGAGLPDLWPQALILALMGCSILAIAAGRFHKTLT